MLKARLKQLTDELNSARQVQSDYESTISRLRVEIQEGSLRAEKSVIEVRSIGPSPLHCSYGINFYLINVFLFKKQTDSSGT